MKFFKKNRNDLYIKTILIISVIILLVFAFSFTVNNSYGERLPYIDKMQKQHEKKYDKQCKLLKKKSKTIAQKIYACRKIRNDYINSKYIRGSSACAKNRYQHLDNASLKKEIIKLYHMKKMSRISFSYDKRKGEVSSENFQNEILWIQMLLMERYEQNKR